MLYKWGSSPVTKVKTLSTYTTPKRRRRIPANHFALKKPIVCLAERERNHPLQTVEVQKLLDLQPSSSIPITYHPLFAPHNDLTLLELEEKLLPEILHQRVTIRGEPDEEAVICTESKSYATKFVGTSNSVIIIPPSFQFHYFEEPKCFDKNYHDRQSAASVLKIAPGTMELVEIAPKLDKLRLLLSEILIYKTDEDTEMGDLEEPERKNVGLYRWDNLIENIQASNEELRNGLQALSAVEIDGYWRNVNGYKCDYHKYQ